MEFRELKSLVLFAELGTLAAVAERMYLSAPAVHKQMKELERELGVQLYEREGRNLQLTQAAQILLPYAREAIIQHDQALQALHEYRGLRRGVLRIGAGPTLSSYVLPGMLKSFRKAHPSIDLLVETGDSVVLTQALRDGRIDLALMVSSQMPLDSGLRVEVSWEVEYVLVTRLREVPAECSIAELDRVPFILFRKGSRIENLIDHYFAELRFRPSTIMTFDNSEAIKAMIRNGFGIAILPRWTIEEDLRKRALRLIRQKERPLISTIELVSRGSGYRPQPIAAFVEMARSFECTNPKLRVPFPELRKH